MTAHARKQLKLHHTDADTGCLYRFVHSETERTCMHTHDYYEVFLTVKGESGHWVNGQQQTLKEGTLVFIRPTDTHLHSFPRNEKCRLVNLAFDEATAKAIFTFLDEGFPARALLDSPLPPMVQLSKKETQKLLDRMTNLCCIDTENKNQLKQRIRVLLAELLSVYFGETLKAEESEIPFWLEYTCQRMRKQQNFSAGTERMVELSGKTREHLGRSMKKYYGVSTTEFINDLRLNYAANMLKNSGISIVELCYECGFQNLSWFYSAFRKRYGKTPKQYRDS